MTVDPQDVGRLRLSSSQGEVEVISQAWLDGIHTPPVAGVIGPKHGYNQHGVVLNGRLMSVVQAGGGPTWIHPLSAFVAADRLYLAAGDSVTCLSLDSFAALWSTETDIATCFGLHPLADGMISHGEIEIARLNFAGEIAWRVSGRDIFTGDFTLEPEWISARDWNDDFYRIAYDGTVLEAPR